MGRLGRGERSTRVVADWARKSTVEFGLQTAALTAHDRYSSQVCAPSRRKLTRDLGVRRPIPDRSVRAV
jgi:hypothetical protein